MENGGAVNFQKACLTLEGCVKVYTKKVDSVSAEAIKLLSVLAEGGEESQHIGDVKAPRRYRARVGQGCRTVMRVG